MRNILLIISVLVTSLLISGCSLKGHKYTADFNTVNESKEYNLEKVSVRHDSKIKGTKFTTVSLRGSSMSSPYGDSFNSYLEYALKEQLLQSNLFDINSNINIKTELLKNNVDSMDFFVGSADISARFIVNIKDKTVYDKIHTTNHTWPSSFAGAIAIPNAMDNYPKAMQKVINKFILDRDFIKIISK